MPRRSAFRGDSQDAGIFVIDDRMNAVMTDHPRKAQEAFKEQIARVREVVPNSNKDDIALVVQYHDGDVDKAIHSFMEDGARTVLNEWRSHGKKGKSASKRNKKKRKAAAGAPSQDEKPATGVESDAGATPSSGVNSASTNKPSTNHSSSPPSTNHSSSTPSTNHSSSTPSNQPPRDRAPPQSRQYPQGRRDERSFNRPHPRGYAMEGRGGNGREGRKQAPDGAASQKQIESVLKGKDVGQRASEPPSQAANDESSTPENTEKPPAEMNLQHIHDTIKSKKLGAVLERSSKDLHRTSVALARHKSLLREKLVQSEKGITKSFDEIQRFLNERKLAITDEFLEVKRETTELLEAREEQAKELEMKTHRAPTMSEEQLLELRAEIKQFVSDRKVDEEIGKSLRFTWNPDQLIDLIKNFGEVVHVHHHYSTRRPSVSSISSLNTLSRSTSVSEDPSPLSARSVSLTESQDPSTIGGNSNPRSPSEMDMKAEALEMAARLQRSLTQGRKGPRNQRGPNPQPEENPGQKRGERTQSDRGQDQATGPRSEQNQGQRPNPNKQERNQNRQDRPKGGRGSNQGLESQGQGSRQELQSGQGARQGQQQTEGVNEQGDQDRSNRYAKRRQNNRKRRQERDWPQESGDGAVRVAPNDTNIAVDSQELGTSSGERTESIKRPSGHVSVNHRVHKSAESVNKSPLPAKERGKSSEHTEKASVTTAHEEMKKIPEYTPNVGVRNDKGKEAVKKVTAKEPRTANGPLLNGNLTMNGDVPHVNGDIVLNGKVDTEADGALPQRQSKARRSQKLGDVVKETAALNGVVDFEVKSEREN